ncbi:hypothetical protein [Eubacterium oxidoreducens]|uniref:Uncharacterized protein n=1 Tax=Eubacterium oxidoreducens TaxID=1732 RepID=A0A1G6CK57_EUBOX|nr:hypothetical protein [Eubacterium oxidoreducens]SDB33241.1 hypothetical protein SAMN02910417_02461 [Eubacterium oxidoreducens]
MAKKIITVVIIIAVALIGGYVINSNISKQPELGTYGVRWIVQNDDAMYGGLEGDESLILSFKDEQTWEIKEEAGTESGKYKVEDNRYVFETYDGYVFSCYQKGGQLIADVDFPSDEDYPDSYNVFEKID